MAELVELLSVIKFVKILKVLAIFEGFKGSKVIAIPFQVSVSDPTTLARTEKVKIWQNFWTFQRVLD